MRRLRELVDRLNPALDMVAFFHKALNVAHKRGRVAADIDDPIRIHPRCAFDQAFSQAFARWIDHDDVWSDSFFFPLGHPVFGIADLKSEVVKLVELGVVLGIFNGCFNDLDSVDGSAFFSKGQRNRPDSAVGIDRGFFSCQVGEPDCGLIKLFRLNRVNLVERLRGNLELEVVQRVLDVIPAKK